MKKILFLAAFALTMSVQAQNDYDDVMAAMIAAKIHQDSIDVSSVVAVYEYTCRTQDTERQAVTDGMKLALQIGSRCTRSFPYRKFLKEQERTTDGTREFMDGYDFMNPDEILLLRAESNCHVPDVWTNYPDEMMTVRDAIAPTIYETREKRKAIDWTLSNDTITIGDYLCKTATCKLNGQRWTVRYCEEIPTTAGPWKLCGLPGLILDAETADGIHRFTISDIIRTASPIYYETNAITTKISEEKLVKMRNKTFGNRLYLKNPMYYITDHSAADEVHDTEGILINGVYVNRKAHVYQPLELKFR